MRADQEIRSDFNGDGYADLAIGGGQLVNSFMGTAGEGWVRVLYGSSTGLTESGAQLWTQESDGIADTRWKPIGGENAISDRFGYALAAGDFDHDGFADLAIGAPGENPRHDPWPKSLGAVHILYGSATGLKGTNEIRWPAKVGIGDDARVFGPALVSGDFDGDGIDDLAITASWREDWYDAPGSKVAVAILRGTRDGLAKTASSIVDQPGFTSWGVVASGDLDGDGIDDVALGLPGERVGQGVVWVVFGDADEVGARSVQIDQGTDGLAHLSGDNEGPAQYEWFGAELAIADFDWDGYDDLAIGAPNEEVPGVTHVRGSMVRVDGCLEGEVVRDCPGAVTIIPGSAGGLEIESSVVLAQGFDGLREWSEIGDYFGGALATGDLNDDGWPDLAIGARGETIEELCEPLMCGQGGVTVVYGSKNGLVPASSSSWTLDTPGVPGEIAAGWHFGASLAVGSFGRGPAADLAIGVGVGHGFVDVLYGATGGPSVEHAQLWSTESPGVDGTELVTDSFGASFSR